MIYVPFLIIVLVFSQNISYKPTVTEQETFLYGDSIHVLTMFWILVDFVCHSAYLNLVRMDVNFLYQSQCFWIVFHKCFFYVYLEPSAENSFLSILWHLHMMFLKKLNLSKKSEIMVVSTAFHYRRIHVSNVLDIFIWTQTVTIYNK